MTHTRLFLLWALVGIGGCEPEPATPTGAVDCGRVVPLSGNQFTDPIVRANNARVANCLIAEDANRQNRAARDQNAHETYRDGLARCRARYEMAWEACRAGPDCDADRRDRIVEKANACIDALGKP